MFSEGILVYFFLNKITKIFQEFAIGWGFLLVGNIRYLCCWWWSVPCLRGLGLRKHLLGGIIGAISLHVPNEQQRWVDNNIITISHCAVHVWGMGHQTESFRSTWSPWSIYTINIIIVIWRQQTVESQVRQQQQSNSFRFNQINNCSSKNANKKLQKF